MMSNRIFNVNGTGDDMLLDVLKLAFLQNGKNTKTEAWAFTNKHGLILLWHYSGRDSGKMFDAEDYEEVKFPAPMTAEQCIPFISAWLKSDDAKTVEMKDWDADADHDGSNGDGWRVYCENWGHVNGCQYAICAVKPAMMWYGK